MVKKRELGESFIPIIGFLLKTIIMESLMDQSVYFIKMGKKNGAITIRMVY